MNNENEYASLGSCCVCDSTDGVVNVVMLHKKCPMPGRGWGCVVCGLSADGAVAVVCIPCYELNRPLRLACRGYPATDGRIPIELLTGEHEHDFSQHPPEDSPMFPEDTPEPDPIVIRILYRPRGGHVHCRLFTAPVAGLTFVKNGDLVFSEAEWPSVYELLAHVCELLPEEG